MTAAPKAVRSAGSTAAATDDLMVDSWVVLMERLWVVSSAARMDVTMADLTARSMAEMKADSTADSTVPMTVECSVDS